MVRIHALSNYVLEVLWRPPCIRAIVTQSDSIDIGSLHVITISGGTIGKGDDSTIHIPEESVNEVYSYSMRVWS